MRAIKFRVFTKVQFSYQINRFIYSDEFNTYDDYKLCLAAFFSYLADQEIECFHELQQYTGLKDQNNDDIYEGDIVKFIYYSNDLENDIGKVEFREGLFGYLEDEDNEFTVLSSWAKESMEIIGNIYQNPELLENDK